jgi:selenocysteine lyase/cysteine desulfurase
VAKIHSGGQAFRGIKEAAAFAYRCFAEQEEKLSARLLEFLNSRANVRIIGKPGFDREKRVPTISFVVDNMKSSTVTAAVDRYKIGIRYGHFYAKRLIDDLGLAPQDGVVRVSMVHYNTLEEVDSLIRAFENIF